MCPVAQDAHRQRIVDWINDARGNATAFDVTTKGILHAVFERGEFWRLRDAAGKPPGLMGWWPSRAVTFLENHDTVGAPLSPHTQPLTKHGLPSARVLSGRKLSGHCCLLML